MGSEEAAKQYKQEPSKEKTKWSEKDTKMRESSDSEDTCTLMLDHKNNKESKKRRRGLKRAEAK